MKPPPLPAHPGTYVLLLRAREPGHDVTIGKLGTLPLDGAWYAYVGSAFGPGGLRARVGRHLREGKSPHWHIDHLLPAVRVEAVWFSTRPEKREEAWVEALRSVPGAGVPLRGFGAGDCGCEGHLVRLPSRPDRELLGREPTRHPVRRFFPVGSEGG